MEWLLTLGIAIITLGGTLSGVALQNNAAAKRALAEINERAGSEAARVAREETAAAKQHAATERAEAASLAGQVVEEFSRDLDEVRAFNEVDDDGFRSWFGSEWRTSKEVALRRVVGRVRNDDDRASLTEVIDALAAQDAFTRWNSTRTPRKFVDDTLLLGLDIAMTMERGQEQGAELLARRADLEMRIGAWEHYVAIKERSEWEEERRQYRAEEAQWEADLDAAREAEAEYARESVLEDQWQQEADREARDAARGAEELMHTYDEEPDDIDVARDR